MMKFLIFYLNLFLVTPAFAQLISSSGGSSSLAVGSPLTGGTAGCVLFDSANSVACDSGFTYGGSGMTVSISGATVSGSSASSFLSVSGTWNTTGLIDGGVLYGNIIDTASNGASILIDLYVNSTRQFYVSKTGVAGANSGFEFVGQAEFRIDPSESGQVNIFSETAFGPLFTLTNNGTGFGCGSSGNECAYFGWSSNVVLIGSHKAGTGNARAIEFIYGDTNVMDYAATTAGTWTIANAVVLPNIPLVGSLTKKGTVCVSTTNQIYYSATTC